MIADWDLWPYRVVEGTGSEVALRSYVMGRRIDAAFAEISAALYPMLRRFSVYVGKVAS